MSNTDQAQEPTMEEILASIRRIISDDNDAEPADEATAESDDGFAAVDAAEDEFDSVDADAMSQDAVDDIDFDNVSTDDDEESGDDAEDGEEDVLELTDVVPDPSSDEGDVSFEDIDTDSDDTEEEFAPAPAPDVEFVEVEQSFAEPETTERIMSETTDTAVATAFGQLASTLLSRDGTTRTLEELVQEMLRPMLKSWLDENLPGIVEDLVRQEIERASRRGGR